MKKVSIIIPTYNEKGNIINLIKSLIRYINIAHFQYEIIIVDDNSPDFTGIIVKKTFKKNKNIKVFIRKKRGLATAILFGIKKSNGNILIGMDADFNHHPKYILSLLKKINNNDLVVGSRFIKGGGMDNKARYLFTLCFNFFLKYVLSFPTLDNMSGFYAIKKNQFEKLPLNTIFKGYGEYHLRLVYYAKKCGLKISETPVYYQDREYGKSKSNLSKMFVTYLFVAIQLSLFNDKI